MKNSFRKRRKLVNRAKEPSSLAGAALVILGAFNIPGFEQLNDPEFLEAVGVIIAGLAAIFLPEVGDRDNA
jgi:protein-S-isoprenylcysteine O-methyltransferase Ste14